MINDVIILYLQFDEIRINLTRKWQTLLKRDRYIFGREYALVKNYAVSVAT